jgi:glutathione S-transferase
MRMADWTLVLGNKNYSSWSLRAWLALRAAGIELDEVVIPLDWPETAAALAAASPSGRVPAARTPWGAVWDSLAIAELAAEVAPDAQLWPRDRAPRARARAVSAEMHAGFVALRRALPMDMRSRSPRAVDDPAVARDIARIQAVWRDCRHTFGAGGPYLFGAVFGVADCMFAPVVSRFRTYAVELDPVCRVYADAVSEYPPFAAWVAAAVAEPWVIDQP